MQILDCTGELCPIPAVKTKKHYEALKAGEQLTVITDYICATETIENYVKGVGGSCQISEISVGSWRIEIEKR